MTFPQKLLHQLLNYISEQAKHIDPRGYRIGGTKGYVRHRESIIGLPGVEFDLRVEGDHIWLRVHRLEAHKPPPAPAVYRDYLDINDEPDRPAPRLNVIAFRHKLAELTRGETPEDHAEVEAREHAAIGRALETYTDLWTAWAEGERPRRKTIALYGDLFALKHQLEAEETANPQELLWGIGIATWDLKFESTSIPFEYPLLTQAVEISLDPDTMALEIQPRATETRIELDAFIACHLVGAADVERAAREHLRGQKDRPVTPFDPSSHADVLKLVVTNLDSRGSYREILATEEAVPPPGEDLVATDSWVLMSRPRSNNYLLEDLQRLQERLESGCEIPLGPKALVTPPSDERIAYEPIRYRGISGRGDPSVGSLEDLYFPLPYNEEQVTIVQRLERAPGVSVQGPPGTGKTHTIANIICHYLATGRRVLVTSRGEPALEVLQSKIPNDVRPLTVALLAGDREGVRQFQASIEAIQHRVSQLNPEQTRHDIDILKGAIDRAHAELSNIDKRIDEIARSQLSEIEVDGVALRAQELAELVVSGREKYGWFTDPLSLRPEHAPPLSEDEAGRLREARRTLGEDLVYVRAQVPSTDDLPRTNEVAELHSVLSRIRTIESDVASGEVRSLRIATPEVLEDARELLARIDEAKSLLEELESIEDGWPLELRAKCRQPSFSSERQALEALFPELDALIQERAEFLMRPVDFPEAGLNSPKTKEAVARAAATGKPFGLISLFGNSEVKEHVEAVRVAGLAPSGQRDWAHVQRFLDLHDKVLSFQTRWNQLSDNLSVPRSVGGVTTLRHVELVATAARRAYTLGTHYDAVLVQKGASVFESAPSEELMGSAAEVDGVREDLLRHLTRAELSWATTKVGILQDKLAGKRGPLSEELRSFVDTELGNPSVSPEQAISRYSKLVAELRRIAGFSTELACVLDFAKRIENAGAPNFAAHVRSRTIEASGDDRVFPATWRKAWNWARMSSHLEAIEARNDLVQLFARRRDLETGLARLYKDMVAKAAWLATKRNATQRVLQALQGYATAIRRIAGGTGPNATRYRRDAREAMRDAAGAVPCWIMSHARISEAMPADIGAFDLVIVDEASQSDLWALPAILRGKKILVVGDDKQVSPDAGFIAHERIQELKDRFLSEQPYGTEMTPEKSLYDLAARVFAAYQVMLREHFRCAPPIIAYSNRVFYKGAISPLRIPTPSERIDPPLVDIYVPDGIRDRRNCNPYEAEAIADEIEAILRDERFARKTLGVVSVLGMEQAKLIYSIVRSRFDTNELFRRRFECGDARTFQGSERDIMFLTMVVDSTNCKALAGNLFEQRFNVAASRARDRMYLIRSVKAPELSEKDLRLTLLAHFDRPMIADDAEVERLRDRCESQFEREVFSELSSRGYRVIPQVKTGAYRIDMVVEGANDTRLAIECDGDEYHGPDRWQHDMVRQRVLERAGWTFWRCFASTWVLRKEDVLADLMERLAALHIEPMGSIERVPSLVESRVWRQRASGDTSSDEADLALESAIVASGPSSTARSPVQRSGAAFRVHPTVT